MIPVDRFCAGKTGTGAGKTGTGAGKTGTGAGKTGTGNYNRMKNEGNDLGTGRP
jgi:hypothetical protein